MPGDMRAFNRAIVEEFRANNGKVDNEMLRDARLVLLTTTGVESGRAHTVPLGDFSEDAGRVVLWASAMGAPKHPAWYRNLAANPGSSSNGRTRTARCAASKPPPSRRPARIASACSRR